MPGSKFKCGVCNANIGNSQTSVQCKGCSGWLHVSCTDISDAELEPLKGFKSLSFVCETCENNPHQAEDRSLHEEVSALNTKFDAFIRKGDEERNFIKQTFADVIADFKRDMSSCISTMKTDIIDCSKLIRQVESSTSARINLLEAENNLLYKKLNRADFVFGGLPDGVKNISDLVTDLGSFYNVPVTFKDINHACFLGGQRAVLVKLNSVFMRDEIMRQYFKIIKTRPLKLADIISDPGIPAEGIDKRVFLNDHFSPAAGKLNALCRRLLKDKRITKFKLINADKPIAKLTLADVKEVEYGTLECSDLLNGCTPGLGNWF